MHRYRFDAATGALQPTDPAVFALPAGRGRRHRRFNARGDRIYLLGELDACVHVLAWDEASGGLELLQSLPSLFAVSAQPKRKAPRYTSVLRTAFVFSTLRALRCNRTSCGLIRQ